MADTNPQTALNTPQLSRVNSKNDAPFMSLGVKKPLETASNADTATIADRNSSDEEKKVGVSEKVESVDENRYVTGQKLFLILIAFVTSIFLVALDQTIVATAIPAIVSKWNVLSKVSWIATAYFLTQAGCMLTAGQLLTIIPTKWVYLVSICIFEIGSLFCGVAWNINFLIFGRAFAGVGAAAIFISVFSIIAEVTKLEQRPLIFGAIGSVFALSSVVGPLLGGVFADKVSWRWAFYINLPFGVIAIGGVLFFLEARPVPPQPQYAGMSTARKWLTVDWIGSVICLGMVTALLLPLQWGGNERPWSDPAVIALLCVFGVTLAMFIGWQYRMGPKAIMPLFMFKRTTQIGTCLEAFFVMLGLLVGTYYLPFFYQAKGSSATQSGIDILPFMLSVVIISGLSGGVINKTGRYWPWLVVSPLLMSVGAGLLYTIDANTSTAKLVGYQIIYGAGIGGALQNTIIAIQAEYAHEEAMVPQATSLVTFLQLVGGLVGLAIAGSIFGNQLQTQLAFYASDIPAETIHMVRQSVQAVFTLPPEIQKPVIDAYIRALNYVFIIAIPSGAFASGSAFFIKNYSLKERSASGGMAL